MEGKTSDQKVTDSAKVTQEPNLSVTNPNLVVSSGSVIPMTANAGLTPKNDSGLELNAGATPKHDSKGGQFDDDDDRDDNRIGSGSNNSNNNNSNGSNNTDNIGSGGSSIALDTVPFIPKAIDDMKKPSLIKQISSFPKKDLNKNSRKIHFSDQVGGKLEESVYCSNLHYSNNEVMRATEPGSTGCCTMS
jgi:hypothetical protein